MTHKTTPADLLLAAFATLIVLSGCRSQPPQTPVQAQQTASKRDAEMRQEVQQQRKKSKAYPVNGSSTNKYIP